MIIPPRPLIFERSHFSSIAERDSVMSDERKGQRPSLERNLNCRDIAYLASCCLLQDLPWHARPFSTSRTRQTPKLASVTCEHNESMGANCQVTSRTMATEAAEGACGLDPQLERKREEGMILRWGRELFGPEYNGLGRC